MPDNPFAPPTSEVRDLSPRPGSPIKGVILGLLVDIGGTVISSMVIGGVFAVFMAQSGMPPEEIFAALSDTRFSSPLFVVSTIAGGGLSVLGGYVCQRIARRSNYRLALVLAGLSTAIGLAMSWSSYSALVHALLTLLNVASVLLGTRLAGRQH